jgi:hypothetical protein
VNDDRSERQSKEDHVSAVGEWTLHYSWGPTNNYGQATLDLNGNGSVSGAAAGSWRAQDGTILIAFDGGPAKYGGTFDANVASGAMTTFAGLDGAWYMLKNGVVGAKVKAKAKDGSEQPHDLTGNGR